MRVRGMPTGHSLQIAAILFNLFHYITPVQYIYSNDIALVARIFHVFPKTRKAPFLRLFLLWFDLAVDQLNSISENQAKILCAMKEIAKAMPEYPVVIEMACVGENLAAQLIAEIGDINRFERKQSLSGYAGIDSPSDQSGRYNRKGKSVTKNGSSHLRRILFLVMMSFLI